MTVDYHHSKSGSSATDRSELSKSPIHFTSSDCRTSPSTTVDSSQGRQDRESDGDDTKEQPQLNGNEEGEERTKTFGSEKRSSFAGSDGRGNTRYWQLGFFATYFTGGDKIDDQGGYDDQGDYDADISGNEDDLDAQGWNENGNFGADGSAAGTISNDDVIVWPRSRDCESK
ncbi:hypothetical protein BCR39DRAFT_504746 [Naematelia encephala]|uniref:Uncharacterized protein n=1 Tax=Naematelia encephala TaxID=71784 RepID=A0A1Y2B9Z4_9TREE|nr:hypothetical protein BCR39DRAFT_504746 [Naematelia encephala]